MKIGITITKFIEEYKIPVTNATFRKWLLNNIDKFNDKEVLVYKNGNRRTIRIVEPEKVNKVFWESKE